MDRERAKNYLFYAFIGTLPLQTAYFLREPFIGGEKWQYGVIAVYGTDILFLSLLAVWLVGMGRSRSKKQEHGYGGGELLLLGLLVCWTGLSILWAPDRILAGYFFVKLLLAAGLFGIARTWTGMDMKRIMLILLIAGVLQGGIGIAQFLCQQSISSSMLGMSAYDASQAGSSVLKIDSGRFLRAYGTLPHPNILGGFLAAVLVIGIGYLARFGGDCMRTVLMSRAELRESGAALRDRFMDTVRMSGITIAGATILLGLILTFSRSAWAGATLGIAFLAMHSFLQGKSKGSIIPQSYNHAIFLKVVGVLGVVAIVFIGVLHEMVLPRFDMAVIEHEGSISERVQSLRDAEHVIGAGNFLFGTGAGNFTAAVMRLEPGRPVWSVQPAHNAFMLIFAELGAVGLLLFAFFAVVVIKSWIPGQVRDDKNSIFFVALIALLPSLFLDHWLWTSHFGLYFFFLLFGLASRK